MVIAVKAPTRIVKRNGQIVEFDENKIKSALDKCFTSVGQTSISITINDYVDRVINVVGHRYEVPTVEQVQDVVEFVLQSAGEYDAAKHYILYRAERTRIRETKSIPQDVVRAYEEDAKFFPTALQRFQFVDKYSRWNDARGRRETWVETVDRAVDYLEELAFAQINKRNYNVTNSEIDFEEIRQAILNMEVMPSMRLLAMAGEPARRDNAVLYNCSYLPIDSIDAFCEIMSNSMAGCGVGFSVEFENVDKLPRVQHQHEFDNGIFVIEDSAEGWVKALRYGLSAWMTGLDVDFNYQLIRPKGSPLKTKGGQASGPDPLRQLLSFIRDRFLARQGKKLTTLDCHDIACAIGNAVVSGGVRRTAMISLFDEDDELMLHCKDGNFADENPQRWNANNSAVWKNVDKMTQGEFVRRMQVTFDSERGEPGIFSREIAWNTMPARRKDQVGYKNRFGTNPCFGPDTIIETIEGKKKIKDITEPTYVYSMDENKKLVLRRASASWITRRAATTVRIHLSNGDSLVVTPEHKIYVEGRGWIQAGRLRNRDRLVGLNRNRRGAKYAGVKLTTQTRDEYVMEHRFLWEGVNGPIPVGHDIHHIDDNSYRNRLNNFELITHSKHATLTRMTRPNNHQIQDVSGRFMISTLTPGAKIVVDMPEELKTNWHQYASVVCVENGPTTDVYDISVEGTHNLIANNIVAHNCGEINLRPWQFCNLSIVVARVNDTTENLRRKVRLATIIGTIQSTATHFPNLRSIWKVNCEEERLLGVDITGQMDCRILQTDYADDVFQYLQHTAIETNEVYAEKLGINPSKSITCNKPSGNSSQLLDCSSGIHARWAPYYIRNVRLSSSSPIVKVLQEAGVTLTPENGEDVNHPATYVVSFPVKAPDGAITRNDRSAVDQCNWWLTNKMYWTEHNPSVTITYKQEEILDLLNWLWHNKGWISGMSFLPRDDAKYDQLPYIEISESEYNAAISKMPAEIDWSKIYLHEKNDHTSASQELACESEVCELPVP